MEVQHNFTSPFAFFNNTDLIPDLKNHIYSQNVEGVESNCALKLKNNLKESKFDFFNTDEKIVKDTMRFISQSLGKFLNNLHDETCYYNIRFNESWFHIGSKYSVHETHLHDSCSWCGVYFVQAGDKGSGDTVFLNPAVRTYRDFGTRSLDAFNQKRIQPEDGLLVLFPSFLNHHQSIYMGNQDRIVVAFNISVISSA